MEVEKMPCRVGITTNPEARKSQWASRCIGMTNWRILGTYRDRDSAQQHENRYAETTGCHAHPGGNEAPGLWYVYRFDYVRDMG